MASAKYQLTEVGHVAKDFKSRHMLTFDEIAEAAGEKKSCFEQARRNERGFEALRKNIMEWMRERDPVLVDESLSTYDKLYRKKEA